MLQTCPNWTKFLLGCPTTYQGKENIFSLIATKQEGKGICKRGLGLSKSEIKYR